MALSQAEQRRRQDEQRPLVDKQIDNDQAKRDEQRRRIEEELKLHEQIERQVDIYQAEEQRRQIEEEQKQIEQQLLGPKLKQKDVRVLLKDKMYNDGVKCNEKHLVNIIFSKYFIKI